MIRIWKIGDKDCPICAEMAVFDRVEIRARNAYYRELSLPDVPNDPRIFNYLKEYVVSDEGTIDIPVYLVEWRNAIIGHIQGSRDRAAFKRELVGLVADRSALAQKLLAKSAPSVPEKTRPKKST